MLENEIKIESLTAPSTSLTAANAPPAEAGPVKKIDWRNFFKRQNKPASAFDVFKLIKYIYPLTIFIIILILFWVMSFLYNNVYLTMSQAEIVSSLKSKVIEESVNFSRFNNIVKKIADKKSLSGWPYLNYLASPFFYGAKAAYPGSPLPAPGAATSSPDTISSTTKSTSTAYRSI